MGYFPVRYDSRVVIYDRRGFIRLATTLIITICFFQEKEKGTSTEQADQPMNLSNQCTIRSQSIIEHIIENMLDEPVPQGTLAPFCQGSVKLGPIPDLGRYLSTTIWADICIKGYICIELNSL